MKKPIAAILPGLALLACAGGGVPAASRYVPRVRALTMVTVPLLTKEQRGTYPFLTRDFAAGGVLEGKEVYAFVPASITVVESDTLRLTIVNPEDDEHNFVLDSLRVALPGQATTHAEYVARRAGIHPFVCDIRSHLPFMAGQLVVLAPGAASQP